MWTSGCLLPEEREPLETACFKKHLRHRNDRAVPTRRPHPVRHSRGACFITVNFERRKERTYGAMTTCCVCRACIIRRPTVIICRPTVGVRHSPAQSSTVHHGPSQSSTIHHSLALSSTVQHSPPQSTTVRHSPAQSSTIQHSQHSTASDACTCSVILQCIQVMQSAPCCDMLQKPNSKHKQYTETDWDTFLAK